jgi:hypothetical protein
MSGGQAKKTFWLKGMAENDGAWPVWRRTGIIPVTSLLFAMTYPASSGSIFRRHAASII